MKRSDKSERRSSSHASVVGKFRKNEFELIAGKVRNYCTKKKTKNM